MLVIAVIILLSYLLGSIPSGLIIGKRFYNTDIREHGSGNLGGTNTFRTLGVKAGLIVTVMDILKGTLATLLPLFFDSTLHMLVAGIVAVIGHMYPLFANFRGGKAVATSGGVLLAYDPILFLILVVVFFISLYISKYVSLSSIIAAFVAFGYTLFTGDVPLIIVVGLLMIFVVYRHRANIIRIKEKTEPKIKFM